MGAFTCVYAHRNLVGGNFALWFFFMDLWSLHVSYSLLLHHAVTDLTLTEYGGKHISPNCVHFWRKFYASAFIGQLAFFPRFWRFEWIPIILRVDLVVRKCWKGLKNAWETCKSGWRGLKKIKSAIGECFLRAVRKRQKRTKERKSIV